MRSKRSRKSRNSRKKGIYVLPNLFTTASLFGGFFAVISAIQGEFETAAIAVLISCVFDGLDGRIARLTQSTSVFGAEYDSLSDLVAFGVAPGILAFQWALEPFGRLGWLACFMFVVCGALRLARFNVQKETQGSHEFKGLPIPAAASCIASLVLFSGVVGELDGLKDVLILILLYVLSFLMVSSIPYVSFKTFDLKNQKPFNVLVAVILILLVIAYRPKVMLPFVLAGYAFSGPVMALYRLRKERSRRRSGETTAPGMGGTFAKSASGAGEGRDSGSDAG